MNKKIGPITVIVILVLLGVNSAFYIVDETKQAILVQLGKPVDGIQGPGLHFKIPFIQDAILFENRILDYDARPAEILTEDKKNLKVDNYAKWKIIDPLKFFQTVRNEPGAYSRLDDIIYAEIRVELGRHLMSEIISEVREEIMEKVTKASDNRARDYGISVVDVRIKRADLPQENERAVFGRMRTERERQAMKYRSEGQEQALKIRAEADRERTIIIAEAYRRSQELRGVGDGEATRIYAEAFQQDPDFFNFVRSLESYRKSIDQKTTFLMSDDEEFLKFLKESGAKLAPPAVEKDIVMPEGLLAPPEPEEEPIKLEALEPSENWDKTTPAAPEQPSGQTPQDQPPAMAPPATDIAPAPEMPSIPETPAQPEMPAPGGTTNQGTN